jgi:putative NADPH-quinone reductase
MGQRIAIIQGHPDPSNTHFGHALADAYADGARQGGHEVKVIPVAELDIPLLHRAEDWAKPTAIDTLKDAQQTLLWANHIVIVYPLWLGDMPAVLKGFLEQVSAGGFMMSVDDKGRWIPKLKGKSGRVVVTMGMPSFAYRLIYFSHSLISLKRNILEFAGMRPVRDTVIGSVSGDASAGHRAKALESMRAFGRSAH